MDEQAARLLKLRAYAEYEEEVRGYPHEGQDLPIGTVLPELKGPAIDPKKQWGEKKIDVAAVPPAAILAMARALGEGVDKYGRMNWRSTAGVEALTYYKGALRHLFAWFDGEDIDPDSKTGKTHLDGAIASLAILIDAVESGYLVDNRPAKGEAPRMLMSGARGTK